MRKCHRRAAGANLHFASVRQGVSSLRPETSITERKTTHTAQARAGPLGFFSNTVAGRNASTSNTDRGCSWRDFRPPVPAAVVLVLDSVKEEFPRLKHLWVGREYTNANGTWIEEHLGWSV